MQISVNYCGNEFYFDTNIWEHYYQSIFIIQGFQKLQLSEGEETTSADEHIATAGNEAG